MMQWLVPRPPFCYVHWRRNVLSSDPAKKCCLLPKNLNNRRTNETNGLISWGNMSLLCRNIGVVMNKPKKSWWLLGWHNSVCPDDTRNTRIYHAMPMTLLVTRASRQVAAQAQGKFRQCRNWNWLEPLGQEKNGSMAINPIPHDSTISLLERLKFCPEGSPCSKDNGDFCRLYD